MDWDYPIKDFFKLSVEERDEYILELVKEYYKKFIKTNTEQEFNDSMNLLIFKLMTEELIANKTEQYEKAEIFYKMTRVFMELQDEKQF